MQHTIAANDFQLFHIPNDNPGSFEEIRTVVEPGGAGPLENIPANLETAMCGGWDTSIPIGASTGPNGLVARVQGVPGRDTSAVLSNKTAGVAERNEAGGLSDIHTEEETGFTYPNDDTVCGFATLCRTDSHPDKRTNGGGQQRDVPGFFCDHPCQRPLDGPFPRGKPGNWNARDSTEVQCGSQDPYGLIDDKVQYACGGGTMKGPGEGFCAELKDKGTTGGLCQDLNNLVYILWGKVVHVCWEPNPLGGPPIPVSIIRKEKGPCGFADEMPTLPRNDGLCSDNYLPIGMYECCSDDEFNGTASASATEIPGDPPTFLCNGIDVALGGDHTGTSCIPCTGEDCRTHPDTNEVIIPEIWFDPHPADVAGGCPSWESKPGDEFRYTTEDRSYLSYFRHYDNARYERKALSEYVPEDDHEKDSIPVSCYGLYDNHYGEDVPEDARSTQTTEKHKRCTIGAYYDDVNFESMQQTQAGKGIYSASIDDDPFADPPQPFEEERDLWYTELGNAFSLINDSVLDRDFDGNITFALLGPDSVTMRSTVQVDEENPISNGSLVRAFDDTVTIQADFRKDRRTIVEWWQRIETEMHGHLSQPTVRILLPSPWSIDLDPLDPLFTPPAPEDDPEVDPRAETIEVQVRARPDLLGDLIAYMERSLLLRIESASIPIVVPIASPTELRAMAQGWESWAKKRDRKEWSGGDQGRAVADKLEEYADRIEYVRALRAELPTYAGLLLKEQTQMSKKLAEWLDENVDTYRAYMEQEEDLQDIRDLWARTQDAYRTYHNVDGFPWCRNDRFTTAIYSLLDPWLPGRETGDITGGFGTYTTCLLDAGVDDTADCARKGIGGTANCLQTHCAHLDLNPFQEYFSCIDLVEELDEEYGGIIEENDASVCDRYFPPAPLLPYLKSRVTSDLTVDFTAFREPESMITLPVLKPIQVRMKLATLKPPSNQLDERATEEPPLPTFPDLPDLPEIPEDIRDTVEEHLPEIHVFKEAAVLTNDDGAPAPTITFPEIDLDGIEEFVEELEALIKGMSDEYNKFWNSVSLKRCAVSDDPDCVKPGTEQDCVDPYDDPKKKCVHFEADLKERLQRIGARPAILLKEDFDSIGKHRTPQVEGSDYCPPEDFACQNLNREERKPRDGWMIDTAGTYDPAKAIEDIRAIIRNATDNRKADPRDAFPYDLPQGEMFQNFITPNGFRLERRLEFDTDETP